MIVPHLRSGIFIWFETLGLHPRLYCWAPMEFLLRCQKVSHLRRWDIFWF